MPIDYAAFPREVSDALRALEPHYEYVESNDRGANGYMVFGQNRVSHANVAIKFYFGEPGVRQHEEPRLLRQVQSQHVLDIHEARRVTGGWAYIITPRCFGGDIDDLLQTRPNVHTAVDTALGICSGASALHAVGMVHRDLKPANIVVEAGIPRIADFGSVRAFDDGAVEVDASRHSVLYRPPESFATGRYSVRGDVYQVGLVIYQLFGGRLPYDALAYFNAADRRDFGKLNSNFERSRFEDAVIRRRAEAGTLANLQSLPDWFDNASKRAMRRMLNPNPNERLASLADIAAELTAIRIRVANWQWVGDVATLIQGNVQTELRPKSEGLYEAYRNGGAGFRRVPKIAVGPMRQIIERLG